MRQPSLADLTRCELLVIHWLAEGKSCEETAIILGCAMATVKRHRLHIYRRLGVANAVSATNFYREAMAAAALPRLESL